MQAADIRGRTRSRTAQIVAAIVAVALVIVAAGAFALNAALDEDGSSVSTRALAPDTLQFDQMRFLEENTWQTPYTAPRVLTSDEIAFIESNTFQTPYHAPVLSHEQTRFIEENTLGYHVPSADYQMYGDAHVVHNSCSPEPLDRMQAGCKEY